jgi:cellulose synthase/poly-beta-1,6-N-acetylglucosamine synthase-like glycosyltransferase
MEGCFAHLQFSANAAADMTNDVLFYLGTINLVACVAVGVSLFLGLRQLRRLSDIPPLDGSPLPQVSVVVAARNEERHLRHALQSLLQLDYDNLEIIVVDDRSTDGTGAILDRMAASYPKLYVDHVTDLPPGWLGKNHALFRGAQRARGELILFSDADVVMERGVLARAVSHLVRHRVDHLPVLFQIRMPSWLLESFVVTFSVYLLTYCRPWKCPNPSSSAHIGIGGFNLIRADVYRQIGTFQAIRMRPDDDLKLGKLVKKHGFRQELLNATDLMYVPWYASLRELIVGMEKNAFSGMDYRVWFALLATLSMLVFNVFPFVAVFIASGGARLIYIAVVASLLTMGLDVARHGNLRPSCCLGFPLGALMFVLIQWRTMFLNLAHDGIRWRGTHYSLAELKANRL